MFFRYPVSQDVQDWVWDNFAWAIQHQLLRPDTKLMTLTPAFFTAPKGRDEKTAQALVNDIARQLRLADGLLTVLPLNRLSPEYQLDYNALSQTAGTWQQGDDGGIIHYDPNLFDTPQALISLLTHEAMHHVLRGLSELPPGGAEAEELATDLHCITMGCGVLEMAGAEMIGWQGYMRQSTRAHALAVYAAVMQISDAEILAHLPPLSRKSFRKAAKHVAKSGDEISRLQAALQAT